ncbi:MAG: hypothetical protein PHE89_07125 [Alphaproteobacteria bacterium]|nr:hypothetical protein [Alphaproteobacteria bacterium]
MTQLTAKRLKPENIHDVVALQETIVQNLHPDEQHFIIKKSEQDFMKTLKNDNNYVLGVYDHDKLVAQSILSLPQNYQEREMPEYEGNHQNEDIAIYKSILVNPHYRKHGLMKKMLETFETLDSVKQRKVALIQIAVDNPASWINAMKHGMHISKVAHDPEDDAMVIYLKKDLQKKQDAKESAKGDYHLKIDDKILHHPEILFQKMQKLSQTMIGGSWDKESQSIVWQNKYNTKTNAQTYFYVKGKSYANAK